MYLLNVVFITILVNTILVILRHAYLMACFNCVLEQVVTVTLIFQHCIFLFLVFSLK